MAFGCCASSEESTHESRKWKKVPGWGHPRDRLRPGRLRELRARRLGPESQRALEPDVSCHSPTEHWSILSVTGGPGTPRGQAGSHRSPRPWWGAGQTLHTESGSRQVRGRQGPSVQLRGRDVCGRQPRTRPWTSAPDGQSISVRDGWTLALFPAVPNWCGRCGKPRRWPCLASPAGLCKFT